MFSSKRLSLARQRRELTAKRVAELSGLTPMTISRLEKGLNEPDTETVEKIARALAYPIDFFFCDEPEEIDEDAVSFRSFSKISAKLRNAALSGGALGLMLYGWIEKRFDLPEPNLLDLGSVADPEEAAEALRDYWALGEKPIGNMISLLEYQGVRVLSLSQQTKAVDAFSFWRDSQPYVFLNNFKTAERSRFDAAHELGHLVLHKHAITHSDKDVERDADRFASAFLMPRNDVRARIHRPVYSDTVIQAKKRWRVSAMALAYRLNKLNRLSDWQFKSLCIELTRRGYRTSEPETIEREKSIILDKVFRALWQERVTKNHIASELKVPLEELEALLWDLTDQT